MEDILMDTIHRLYARAVTLADAAAKEEENQGRKEFLTDLIDSINEKTARLLLMRERVQRKMKKMNIKCHTTSKDQGERRTSKAQGECRTGRAQGGRRKSK